MSSMKGCLIIPRSVIPIGVSEKEFAEQWANTPGQLVFVDTNCKVKEIDFYASTLEALKKSDCLTMKEIKMIKKYRYDACRTGLRR